MKVFTIGYGGRTGEELLSLLQTHQVCRIVDVRLRPDRASMGIFVKAKMPDKGIQKLLNSAGIEYVSLPELGNLFLDYEDWKDRYRQLLERAGELLLARLLDIPSPLCLMCAEKKAEDCHRTQLAEYLAQTQSAEVQHIQ